MKKLYFLAVAALFSVQTAFAGAACTIDPNNTQVFSPSPDSIPCVERGVPYSQVLQIHVPTTIDIGPFVGFPAGIIILTVDSLNIDSITGFPTGLAYAMNPSDGRFLGGENGCALAYGTTNDPAGNYPLHMHGVIGVSGIPGGFGFPPDTTFQLSQAQSMSQMFNLGLDVIEQGAPCRPVQAGINDFNSALNASISLYPNPNKGAFELRMNAGGRVEGEVVVVDAMGRKVYSQAIDVTGLYTGSIDLTGMPKGLYTLQIRTNTGFAGKNIVIE